MDGALGRAKTLSAGFTPGQRGVVIVAVIALIMGAIALANWVAQPTWTPLYSQLSGSDTSAIVEELQAQGTQYQLADGGNTIMVPQSQVYDVRVALAGKNLPANPDGSGWELLDQQGMTTTDFQQNVAYERAVETELAKTVGAITGVRTAVVNLAIPKRDVFTQDEDVPTAAVLVQLNPGTELSKTQVRSISNLVAGSVPGLDPEQVTITDGDGNLLTSPGGYGDAASAAGDTDQQVAQFEDRMSSSLQQMLDQVLGKGKSVVRVSAQLNYDSVETTRKDYLVSPTVVPLNEATSQELYGPGVSAYGGQMGVLSPTLSPYTPGDGTGEYLKQDRTVNNALGEEVSTTKKAPGGVERLSVAVILDAQTLGATDPTTVQQLVASAAGVDVQRGDIVQVDKLPFDTAAAEEAQKQLAEAQAQAQTAQYIDMGQKAGLVLLAIIVGLVMMRRRKKSSSDTSIEVTASDLPEGMLVPARMEALAAERMRALNAGPPEQGGAPAIERDQLRDEIAAFVDSQPEEIAQLVQGWLDQRGG